MKQIFTPGNAAIIIAATKKQLIYFVLLLLLLPLFSTAQQGNNNNSPQFIPELVFQNPTLVSGTDKMEGATYRFSNVASGIDALLEIKKVSDAATVISDLDKSDMGWKKAFQPQLGRNGNVGSFQNWWIRFHITFVEATTTKKMVLSKFYVTALDVDGDNVSIQEYVQMQKADSVKFSTFTYLSLTSPMDCGLPNSVKDKLTQGPVKNFTDIDTSGTAVMATYTYLNTSDLDFTIGAKSGSASSSVGQRLNSLWFKSFSLAPKIQGTLPLHLLHFQGNVNNSKASLQWTVGDNETGDFFELEKSLDGKEFSTAALVFTTTKAGSENYSFKESIQARTYYRLKMVNKDNSFSYSNIIILTPEGNADARKIQLLQNPVGSSLQFVYKASRNETSTISIYNSTGIKLISQQVQTQQGSNTLQLQLDSKITSGYYLLEVVSGESRLISKFIKQ